MGKGASALCVPITMLPKGFQPGSRLAFLQLSPESKRTAMIRLG